MRGRKEAEEKDRDERNMPLHCEGSIYLPKAHGLCIPALCRFCKVACGLCIETVLPLGHSCSVEVFPRLDFMKHPHASM